MTKLENARYDAAERGSLFLTTHETELMAIVLYAALKTRYFDIFDKITQARLIQIEQTGDLTALKSALKSIMLNIVYKYMLRASVQAFNLNKTDLAVSLGKHVTWLSQGTDNDAVDRCTQVLQIMSANAATLTVLKPEDLDDMDNAIKDFNLVLATPKSKIKVKKAEGTGPIPGLLSELDIIKDQISKLILSYLPQLSPTWEAEIKVGQPSGIRHTSLAVKYLDANTMVALPKVKVTIVKGSQTTIKYTTKRGWIRVFNLESGNYTITAEHETVETSILSDIGVNNLRIVRLEVKLQKKKPGGDIETQTGSFLITALDQATGNPVPDLLLTIASLNRTFDSDEDAQFFGDAIPPASYDALISGENIATKDFSFTITAKQQTELTVSVELIDEV